MRSYHSAYLYIVNEIAFQEYHVMLYEGVMENTCHCRGLVRLLLRKDRYNQGFLQSCHQHLKQLELKVTSLLKQKQGWPAELPNLFRVTPNLQHYQS